MRRFVKITLEGDGLWGEKSTIDHERVRVPIGVMRDGVPTLVLQQWEDERENCDHCGGLMCVGSHDDEDDRCGRCNKSHIECEVCDRIDAEVCIGCDSRFCTDCWAKQVHLQSCSHAIDVVASTIVLDEPHMNVLREAARLPIMEADIGLAHAQVATLRDQGLLHWDYSGLGTVPTQIGHAVLRRKP